jgi:glutamine synthetase
VAREFNLIACFMTKPFMGVSANGCHHNMSLWRGGKDEFVRTGNDPKNLPGMKENYMYVKGGDNTFMPDGSDPQMPQKAGLHAIGGIVHHLRALTAIGASTVNSYRRLWDTGFWAPVFADWGFQNRTTGLRVSAPGRFEYRSVDSMVNPYLMGATILAAADDGIDNKLDPGKPEERNIYQAMKDGKQVKKLPMSLGEALEALEKDKVVQRGMPGEMYRIYHEYKSDEWARFMSQVTEWDSDMYLECLP